MPQPLEYNPAMGSPEAHQAVMKNRADNAKAEYERVATKPGISQAAVDNARQEWEQRQKEYDEFITGGSSESKAVKTEIVQ